MMRRHCHACCLLYFGRIMAHWVAQHAPTFSAESGWIWMTGFKCPPGIRWNVYSYHLRLCCIYNNVHIYYYVLVHTPILVQRYRPYIVKRAPNINYHQHIIAAWYVPAPGALNQAAAYLVKISKYKLKMSRRPRNAASHIIIYVGWADNGREPRIRVQFVFPTISKKCFANCMFACICAPRVCVIQDEPWLRRPPDCVVILVPSTDSKSCGWMCALKPKPNLSSNRD